ncbi:MAG TPA: transglutaminase-like domain-containing protein [Verrucomicrobiae bacterium]|nr:transglutaminase-like domain-containing protein [Verrucomicrobiae bacterium]
MKPARFTGVLLAAMVCFAASGFAGSVLDEAGQLEANGKFTRAEAVLQTSLTQAGTNADERGKLEFAADRLERIRLDYPFTREALFAKLQKSVRDVSQQEFEQWIAEKRFDVRVIDGQERFMGSSVANLFWRYPELNPRRTPPKDESFQIPLWQTSHDIREAAAQGHPYVLPKDFDVTMTVKLDAGVVKPGEMVRAWLPVARRYEYQDAGQIISSSSPVKELAPETSAIRSAYLEQPAASNAPTVFTLHYHYATRGVWFDVNPDRVAAFDGKDAGIAKFTNEVAHVTFTPAMRELSEKIVGGEKNPARVAKKIYEWIGTNIQYSFATEYSTIPNISEYCREQRYGDCGEAALLYITLCRLNGIPARWQTGWDTFPGAEDIHDWTEIYLAPYGWVPVDPFMSIFATQYADKLTPEQKGELRNFYFGGRNQWRMAANADHEQALSPAKRGFRSDDVDFQRGELEAGGTNIYFNHYHYAFEVKEAAKQVNHLK